MTPGPPENLTQDTPASPSKNRRRNSYVPFFFVVGMFAVWFLFDLLARVVVTCMPGGDVCVLKRPGWPLQFMVFPSQDPAVPVYLYGHKSIDIIVSLLTLCLAIWVVFTVAFPQEDDLTQSATPGSGR